LEAGGKTIYIGQHSNFKSLPVGDAASAGWQVTLCDPMWHTGFHSFVVLRAQTAICFLSTLQSNSHYCLWLGLTAYSSGSRRIIGSDHSSCRSVFVSDS